MFKFQLFKSVRVLSTSSGGKDDNWKKFEVSKKLPKRAIADKKTFKGKVVPYINYLQSYQRIGIVFINTTNLSIKIVNMNEIMRLNKGGIIHNTLSCTILYD